MEYDKHFKEAISGCYNIEEVLDRFFGFLERNTDVYHNMIDPSDYEQSFGIELDDINKIGFPHGYLSSLISRIVSKYRYKYAAEHQPYLLKNTELAARYLSDIDHAKSARSPASSKSVTKKEKTNITTGFNSYNGGVTEYYIWSQSLTDLTIEIDCKICIKRNAVIVNITPLRLFVKTPNFEISGEWCDRIDIDNEFNWFIQDSRVIVISIDKSTEGWWDCLLKGDPKIDTGKIESVKKLSEFDEKTQHFIRNAMENTYNN